MFGAIRCLRPRLPRSHQGTLSHADSPCGRTSASALPPESPLPGRECSSEQRPRGCGNLRRCSGSLRPALSAIFAAFCVGTGLSAPAPLRRARVSLSACAASTSCNSLQGWYSRRRRCPMRIAADAQLLSRALPMRYRIIATFSSSQAGAPAARWPRRSARPVRASPQDRLTLISKNWSARVWPRLMAAIGRPNSLARRQKR